MRARPARRGHARADGPARRRATSTRVPRPSASISQPVEQPREQADAVVGDRQLQRVEAAGERGRHEPEQQVLAGDAVEAELAGGRQPRRRHPPIRHQRSRVGTERVHADPGHRSHRRRHGRSEAGADVRHRHLPGAAVAGQPEPGRVVIVGPGCVTGYAELGAGRPLPQHRAGRTVHPHRATGADAAGRRHRLGSPPQAVARALPRPPRTRLTAVADALAAP